MILVVYHTRYHTSTNDGKVLIFLLLFWSRKYENDVPYSWTRFSDLPMWSVIIVHAGAMFDVWEPILSQKRNDIYFCCYIDNPLPSSMIITRLSRDKTWNSISISTGIKVKNWTAHRSSTITARQGRQFKARGSLDQKKNSSVWLR